MSVIETFQRSPWSVGLARAISPDAHFDDQSACGGSVPAALRSLGAGLAPAILASLGQQRRLDWHGQSLQYAALP